MTMGAQGLNRFSLARFILVAALSAGAALLAASPASAARIRHPVAVFAGLDKITGRTIAFEASAGETVQFGTLQITERACFTHPATETPQTATFVEVDEVSAGNQYKRIFSGWMFAASPGLHGIEHPIYDIWLTGCQGDGTLEGGPGVTQKTAPAQSAPVVQQGALGPEQKKPRRPRQGGASESPASVNSERPGKIEQEQPAAEPPPLGEPIEVDPPPGFIPVPPAGRAAPAQRFYPAESGGASEPADSDLN